MSRSYKKHPIYKWKDREGKRFASRAFRRYKEDLPVRAKQFYRRVYNSYKVWDNRWFNEHSDKDRKRFKQIACKLKDNLINQHLTEHEAYDLLDELKELKFCFNWITK